MNKFSNIEIFAKNKTELKEASKDDHDGNITYMTHSTLNVVGFDAVKSEYVKNLSVSETPKSVDALFLGDNGECVFIEFKNGYVDTKKEFDVRLKIFDSLLIFTDIVSEGVSYTRKNVTFIFVYNEGRNPLPDGVHAEMQVSSSREAIARYFIEGKAKKKYIRFNLERFEKLYFKDVFTLNQELFEERFVSMYE